MQRGDSDRQTDRAITTQTGTERQTDRNIMTVTDMGRTTDRQSEIHAVTE